MPTAKTGRGFGRARGRNNKSPVFSISAAFKAHSQDIRQQTGLSDQATIRDAKWADIRKEAMGDDYKTKSWYTPLKPEERKLLEALRTAQEQQGNMDELKAQPYI